MKTTLEVPEDLYLKVKAQAALRRRKIKDYVAEGLRLALKADVAREAASHDPLAVFEEIRKEPYHDADKVQAMIEEARAGRKASWLEEAS